MRRGQLLARDRARNWEPFLESALVETRLMERSNGPFSLIRLKIFHLHVRYHEAGGRTRDVGLHDYREGRSEIWLKSDRAVNKQLLRF